MDEDFENDIDINRYNVNSDSDMKKNTWHWVQVTSFGIIKIVLSIIAAYLSWTCSSSSNIVFRILITLLSICFSEIYIIYYSIYRIYMGNSCPI